MKNPVLAYRQSSVLGATPLGLVVMLYDGAITAMKRAVSAVEAGDIQDKCIQIKRALAIIAQLEGSLNFERGGEAALTLKTFYAYARTQVLKANLQNSPEILSALMEKFSTVREAWHEAEQRSPGSSSKLGSGASSSDLSPAQKLGSWRMYA